MLKIVEAREARGWTQEQLAQAIGSTQQTIQRWESGIVDPKSSKIVAISNALGVTVSFLLGISETIENEKLTADEAELLNIARSVSNDGLKHLLIYARGVKDTFPKKTS